jgi:hypothetical protein
MNKARLILIPLLLAAAACGSDSGSSTDTASTDTASADTASTDTASTDTASTESTGTGGGSELTADQQAAVDQLLSQEDAAQVFDRACVEDKAAQLSDEDARAIVDAGPDGEPDLSAEGKALTLELVNCFDNEALIDAFIDEMKSSGTSFDEDCVRQNLKDFDLGQLAQAAGASGGSVPEDLLGALVGCFDLGGS